MLRGRRIRCATVSGTNQDKWRQLYGTDAYGNLPQHKKNQHVGHCWMPCPYDTVSFCDTARTQAMTGYFIDPFYDPDTNYMTISGTIPFTDGERIEHYDVTTGKHVYMNTASKGTMWGYECTYSGCPYKTYHNKPYFYV